jgi:hypothetical protein
MSKSPAARRTGRAGQLPGLPGSPAQTASPYRKAAAKPLRGSWKSVALPDIPGMSGPAGPADGPLSPDPMFLAKESKALSAWVQAAQRGDAEAQNNLGVSYYRGINGVQKVARRCMLCQWPVPVPVPVPVLTAAERRRVPSWRPRGGSGPRRKALQRPSTTWPCACCTAKAWPRTRPGRSKC